MDRAERRARTKRIVRRRIKDGKHKMFGLDPDTRLQPHRQHKHKQKYTHDRSSLKEDKQIASRRIRHGDKIRIKNGKDIIGVSKKYVRWEYW